MFSGKKFVILLIIILVILYISESRSNKKTESFQDTEVKYNFKVIKDNKELFISYKDDKLDITETKPILKEITIDPTNNYIKYKNKYLAISPMFNNSLRINADKNVKIEFNGNKYYYLIWFPTGYDSNSGQIGYSDENGSISYLSLTPKQNIILWAPLINANTWIKF